eukprot:scaffold272196_cov27-Tisochrysis_lutea.AAC.1
MAACGDARRRKSGSRKKHGFFSARKLRTHDELNEHLKRRFPKASMRDYAHKLKWSSGHT